MWILRMGFWTLTRPPSQFIHHTPISMYKSLRRPHPRRRIEIVRKTRNRKREIKRDKERERLSFFFSFFFPYLQICFPESILLHIQYRLVRQKATPRTRSNSAYGSIGRGEEEEDNGEEDRLVFVVPSFRFAFREDAVYTPEEEVVSPPPPPPLSSPFLWWGDKPSPPPRASPSVPSRPRRREEKEEEDTWLAAAVETTL